MFFEVKCSVVWTVCCLAKNALPAREWLDTVSSSIELLNFECNFKAVFVRLTTRIIPIKATLTILFIFSSC